MLTDEQLVLSEGAIAALMTVFRSMAQVHDRENGNGRAVRNLLERAKRSQALRLMQKQGRKTREELSLLTEEDFEESLQEMANATVQAAPARGAEGAPPIAVAPTS